MRRLLSVLCASVITMALTCAPTARAAVNPWFSGSVGPATQVLSVTGTGGSDAKLDVWQRTGAGWQPVTGGIGIPAKIGAKGMSANHFDGSMMTRKASTRSTSPSAPSPTPAEACATSASAPTTGGTAT